jgi:CHAP domain
MLTAAGVTAAMLASAGPAAAATMAGTGPATVPGPVRTALTEAYASYRHIPAGDIAGIRPGSLHVSASQGKAAASFLPRLSDPRRVLLGFQDSAATAHFVRGADGTWRVVRTGVPVVSSPPVRRPVPHLKPATANPTQIAGIAENNVGVGDTPASTDWGLDCDPYTTMVDVGVSTSGCGVDPTFGVQDENEEWCADFTKWVWEQGGVTADLGTLDPAAASFYTWGQEQGEGMPTDPTDPAVGDAVVFYPSGSAPNGNYADHVGIVTAVNSDGTVDLVNGDFLGSSNITVQYNTDVNLGPWAADVWGSG